VAAGVAGNLDPQGVCEVSILLDGVTVLREQLTVSGNWQFWFPAGVFNTCYGRR
jgi:hypothetical protein